MNRTQYDLQILHAHILKTSSWCCSLRGTAGWLGPVHAKPLCVQHLKFFSGFATWLEEGNSSCRGDRFYSSNGFKSWNYPWLFVFCNWDPMQEQPFVASELFPWITSVKMTRRFIQAQVGLLGFASLSEPKFFLLSLPIVHFRNGESKTKLD